MPSSRKTDHFLLNLWSGTDKPKRIDFNSDNEKIDSAVKTIMTDLSFHTEKTDIHVTAAEKNQWNLGKSHSIVTYQGNGALTRVIDFSRGAKFALVFAVGRPPVLYDGASKVYSGFLSANGSSDGLTLLQSGLSVLHQNAPSPDGVMLRFNEIGLTYVCIYW